MVLEKGLKIYLWQHPKKESEENTDNNEMSYVESDLQCKSIAKKVLGFSGFNRNCKNLLGRINCKQPCFQ